MWLETPPPAISPEVVARIAVSRLVLPSVVIRVNPAADQLVGLPSWFWVDGGSWRPQSATASVPGLSVTATAVPVRTVWSTGDGASVGCAGPGTPWRFGMDPRAVSPSCGHTYTRPSPAGRLTLRVTVTWTVTWAGSGASGTAGPLATTAAASVRVVEAGGLNTEGGDA